MLKNKLPILITVLLAAVSIEHTVYAAESADYVPQMLSGVELGTFDDNLVLLAQSLLKAGKIIALIMTAVAGVMVAFGIEDGKKSLWNWMLGIGMALSFADFIMFCWGNYLQPIQQINPPADFQFSLADSQNPDINILGSFMIYWQRNVILPGSEAIAPIAMRILLVLTLIDSTIKLSMDLISGDKIKFLIITCLRTGFFLFLIENWVNGIGLMASLSQGFEQMGLIAAGSDYVLGNDSTSTSLKPDSIVNNAMIIWNAIYSQMSFTNIPVAIVSLICAFTTVILLFLTGIEMFMVRIEFYTLALITIPLLAFGTIKQLNFLTEKAIGAMFNLAIKIFVISFLTVIANKLLYDLTIDITEASAAADFWGNISLLLQVVLVACILFFMVRKIPAIVQGLLSGNPSLGGGDMRTMAMDAVNKGSGAAGVAQGAIAKGYASQGMKNGGMNMMMSALGNTAKAGVRGSSPYKSFMGGSELANPKPVAEPVKDILRQGDVANQGKASSSAEQQNITKPFVLKQTK